jgi:hypothetical protein
MNADDPISQLVRMYKHSLLTLRTYRKLAGQLGLANIPAPSIQSAEQELRPALEAEFRVYEQYLREGYSPQDALAKLLGSFPDED